MSLYKFLIDLNQNELAEIQEQLNVLTPYQKLTQNILEAMQSDLFNSQDNATIYLERYIKFLITLKNSSLLAAAEDVISPQLTAVWQLIHNHLLTTPARPLYLEYRRFKSENTTNNQDEIQLLASFQLSQNLSQTDMNELNAYLDLVDIAITLESLPNNITVLINFIDEQILHFQQDIKNNENFTIALTERLAQAPELNNWLLNQRYLNSQTINCLQLELNQQKHFASMLDSALATITEKSQALDHIKNHLTAFLGDKKPNRAYIELYTQFLQTMQNWSKCVEKFSHDFYQLSPGVQTQYPIIDAALKMLQQTKVSLLEKCHTDWENTGYGFQGAMTLELSKTPELKTWIFQEIENLTHPLTQTPTFKMH